MALLHRDYLTDLRQGQETLNIALKEGCLRDPPGYYPWLVNEGRQEKKKILNMEYLSFDAGERMAPFRWSPVLQKGKQPARKRLKISTKRGTD